jgi:hypothetical protein
MEGRKEPSEQSKYQDIKIFCMDCDKEFTFTSEEQQFFYSKGLSTPKRCQPCRKARKASIVREERW